MRSQSLFCFFFFFFVFFFFTNEKQIKPVTVVQFDNTINYKRIPPNAKAKIFTAPTGVQYKCVYPPNLEPTKAKKPKTKFGFKKVLFLNNTCHRVKSGHLIYELCHLDQVKQIEKQFLKQDIEESLGTFTNWEILGGGDSPLLILHYTEGSYCEEEKRKKETTVYYQCLPRNQLNNPKSTETSIISFQKVNSCDYLGIVHVQEFCKNSFDHQNPPVVTGFQCIQMTDE
ncbi:endoplasmic reticulum lectin 1 [Anaeramoeba flamelloides]|uniref:Endoplasmic reticulum lectin 1 n=1 Tax=Anaeramoeba flamelloides TaxID=1746091 RepID=A0ABQ8X9S6_9EUKA|nr:endoplasmic reticulum lectin 1 [Anaeramoeba flamelloides]